MKMLRYLWRDKVDLILFILSVLAFVQVFFRGADLTLAFGIVALYIFGVMHRMGAITDHYQQVINDLTEVINELKSKK